MSATVITSPGRLIKRTNTLIRRTFCLIMSELITPKSGPNITSLNISKLLSHANTCSTSNQPTVFDIQYIPETTAYNNTVQILNYINNHIKNKGIDTDIPFNADYIQMFLKACIEVDYAFPKTVMYIGDLSLGARVQFAESGLSDEDIARERYRESNVDELKSAYISAVNNYNHFGKELAEVRDTYNKMVKKMNAMKEDINQKKSAIFDLVKNHPQSKQDIVEYLQQVKLVNLPKSVA